MHSLKEQEKEKRQVTTLVPKSMKSKCGDTSVLPKERGNKGIRNGSLENIWFKTSVYDPQACLWLELESTQIKGRQNTAVQPCKSLQDLNACL